MTGHSDTKWCRRCQRWRPREEFHVDRKASDGLMGCCKVCNRARVRAWRRKRRKALEDNRAAVARYRAKNRDALNAKNRERYRENLEANRAKERARWHRRVAEGKVSPKDARKVKARKALETALRSGRMVRPKTCPQPGCEGLSDQIEFHHTSYEDPLEGEWACSMCHRRLHHV